MWRCDVARHGSSWQSVGDSPLFDFLRLSRQHLSLPLSDMDSFSGIMKQTETRASTTDSQSMTTSAAEAAKVSSGRDCCENWECGADWMARVELEAAEALAGLANSAMRESETAGWNAGERPSHRVKNESVPGDSGMNPEVSVFRYSDPAEDPAVVQKQCEKRRVKVEQDDVSTTSYACSKTRQSLVEAEKEARRIRRVLANRESARQTIRHRQDLHEKLTRKAISLTWENENLKRVKELAVKDYHSLKSTNEYLTAQLRGLFGE